MALGDFDRLKRWDHGSFIKFNKAKYKVLHMGQGNQKLRHRLGREWIQSSPEEKDLAVLVDKKLNMIQQRASQISKSSVYQVCNKSSLTSRSREVILTL